MCPLNYQKCLKKEDEGHQDKCLVCMKRTQSTQLNNNLYDIQKCFGLSESMSHIIVISNEKMNSFKKDNDWKELQAIPRVSNIMYGDTHVLFRAAKTLGFTCKETFKSCYVVHLKKGQLMLKLK